MARIQKQSLNPASNPEKKRGVLLERLSSNSLSPAYSMT
jgi:hypothetical protein